MISRLIALLLLPWGGYLGASDHPWLALLVLASGTVALFWSYWSQPWREPTTVSQYRRSLSEVDAGRGSVFDSGSDHAHLPPRSGRGR